jgi:hypothetical protein
VRLVLPTIRFQRPVLIIPYDHHNLPLSTVVCARHGSDRPFDGPVSHLMLQGLLIVVVT